MIRQINLKGLAIFYSGHMGHCVADMSIYHLLFPTSMQWRKNDTFLLSIFIIFIEYPKSQFVVLLFICSRLYVETE